MKKLLLLGLMLVGSLSANAQLADGTVAPDFTAQDINGNTHTLSTYLEEGKTVILYISATWCGPCWQFHNTHYLADLYESYGPGGSDEIVILYVEGDSSTTLADIQGTGSNTWGDWTAGSPFPILDNAQIANSYAITAYPTLYMICPETGTTTEIDRNTPAGFVETVEATCGGTLTGIANRAEVRGIDRRFCANVGEASANVRNLGTADITTATVVLKENGSVVATATYSGDAIPQFGSGAVSFDEYEFDANADYTVEITQYNEVTAGDDELLSAEATFTLNAADENLSGINIKVDIYTDYYPGEMSWNLLNSAGDVVASGGPYQPGNEDQYGGGGADALTVKTEYFTLSEDIDCYSIELLDSYGDGWSAYNQGTFVGVKIFTGSQSVFEAQVGNFGPRALGETIFKTTGQLDNPTFETAKFAVYPNPTSGILNFTTEETVNVTVVDLSGKVVFTANNINNGDSINLNSLQTGMYIAKINGETTERVEKIVIK